MGGAGKAGDDRAERRLVSDLLDYWTPIALRAATQRGVIEAMGAGARPTAEIAAATGTDTGTLRRVLRALAGRGLVVEGDDDSFGLTERGRFLLASHPQSLAGAAIHNSWDGHAWAEFDHSLVTGESAFLHHFGAPYFEWLRLHPEANARYDAAMQRRTAGLARLALPLLDLPTTGGTVADVGGGRGVLLAQLLEARPDLTGTLFDQAHVVADAQASLIDEKVASRISFVSGDFFAEIPAGMDYYVMASILHDWNDLDAARILTVCRRAMSQHSRLFILDAVLTPANEWDTFKALDLHMLVHLGGRERSEPEWRDLIGGAGLAIQAIIPTPGLAWIEVRRHEV